MDNRILWQFIRRNEGDLKNHKFNRKILLITGNEYYSSSLCDYSLNTYDSRLLFAD